MHITHPDTSTEIENHGLNSGTKCATKNLYPLKLGTIKIVFPLLTDCTRATPIRKKITRHLNYKRKYWRENLTQ